VSDDESFPALTAHKEAVVRTKASVWEQIGQPFVDQYGLGQCVLLLNALSALEQMDRDQIWERAAESYARLPTQSRRRESAARQERACG
jgi:hypothetical protein